MDTKRLITGVAFLWCLLPIGAPGIAADFEGKVISVIDGDTIEVLHDNKPERIRLYGIEGCQPMPRGFTSCVAASAPYTPRHSEVL